MGLSRAWLVGSACVLACAKAGAPNAGGDAPAGGDAATTDSPMRIDAAIDAAIDAPPPAATHVLLSEVMLAPTGAEFIEITNPTGSAVDLSTYYLADTGDYWQTPLGSASYKPKSSDFVAHFPAGTTIAPGGVTTMAIGTAQAFHNFTNIAPDFSLADGTMVTPYAVGSVSLTDAGEIVVLFQWDGSSPVVADVDMLLVGSGAGSANGIVSKSGSAQGSGQYQADANTLPAQTKTPASGLSTKRIAIEGAHETHGGAGVGNGITGDDETTEDTTVTWDSTFTSPTPGSVPGQLLPP